MSRTTLIEFSKNFKRINEIEYANSWGSLPRIWEPLFVKYFKKERYEDYLSQNSAKQLVSIYNTDDKYPMFERIVMGITLDYAIIYKKNFIKMAEALEEFNSAYPREGFVNHLPAFAEAFRKSKAIIIGFHLTSVCEDPWDIPVKERSKRCFDIIDELNNN